MREGSGQVGEGRVWSGWYGEGLVRLVRGGSGQVGMGSQVGKGREDLIRLAIVLHFSDKTQYTRRVLYQYQPDHLTRPSPCQHDQTLPLPT